MSRRERVMTALIVLIAQVLIYVAIYVAALLAIVLIVLKGN